MQACFSSIQPPVKTPVINDFRYFLFKYGQPFFTIRESNWHQFCDREWLISMSISTDRQPPRWGIIITFLPFTFFLSGQPSFFISLLLYIVYFVLSDFCGNFFNLLISWPSRFIDISHTSLCTYRNTRQSNLNCPLGLFNMKPKIFISALR